MTDSCLEAAAVPRVAIRSGLRISLLLIVLLCLTALAALSAGRFHVAPERVAAILAAPWLSIEVFWSPMEERVVESVRLPRMLLAGLVGAGLAAAGAALQSVFRNPLAEPQLLGVSSGAAFGGVLALWLASDGWPLVGGALIGGLASLLAVFWLAAPGKAGRSSGTVLLVLAGIVVSAVCAAGVSLIKLVADPQNQLPAIVFWLMGSLASASHDKLVFALPCIGGGLLMLYGLRFHLMALALGDEDARNLGVPVTRVRSLTLLAVGLITAASVAVCGVVGWVGLVVPHLVRMSCGADHRDFVTHTLLAGGIYLVAVDTLARTLSSVEIPLGVLTALFGAPLFAVLVRRLGKDIHV